MRRATLIQLLNDLRAECRLSLNPAQNAQVRDTQVAQLQRIQDWLWEDTTWPHLRVFRDMPVQTGQRLYWPPNDIDIQRIEAIHFRYGNQWQPLKSGIGDPQYDAVDSDLKQQGWPVERWDITEPEEIELWPIPANSQDPKSLDGTLRIYGIKNLRPLVDDADVCDLDRRLIVAFAAAENLAARGEKDAKLRFDEANRLYNRIKAGLTPRRDVTMFVDAPENGRPLRGPPRVHYRTTP